MTSSAESARASRIPRAPLRRIRDARASRRLDKETRLELVGHLEELRRRLFVCAGAVSVGFVAAFVLHRHIIEALNAPLHGVQPVTLGVAEPFMTAIRISFLAAMAIALPVLFWQAWMFIAPACEQHVRRAVARYVASGGLLFAAGAALGYFVALPQAIGFLTNFDSSLYDVQLRAQEYYTFAAAVLLCVGAVFQLPVVLLGLVRFRVLTYDRLRSNRKIAYVALTGLAVLMPGVDPVTTTMWIVPLALLFEVSVLLARRTERTVAKLAAAEAPADSIAAVDSGS